MLFGNTNLNQVSSKYPMSNKPLKIGITGGIGSGKTLVSRLFSILGIPVYDADTRAKWLINFHPEVKKEITQFLGEESYSEGRLNTRYVAEKVFNDKAKTEKINAIVHPRVGEDFADWAKQHDDFPYLLKEAALLYESGSYKQLDKIIVVSAPAELKLQRIILRDPQRSVEEVKAIMDKQMPDRDKQKMADFIVYNDEQQLVIPQVIALDKQIRGL